MDAAALDVDFSLDRLSVLLQHPRIVWKHDVDFDLRAAVDMAELEHTAGVKATFYVMARGDNYNPFSRTSRELIHKLRTAGHDVGVHVDLGLDRDADVQQWVLEKSAASDHRLLQSEYPFVARKVSFHSPPRTVRWRHVRGFEHALEPKWENRYVTDSRGVLWQTPENNLPDGGHMLFSFHPEWWFWPHARAERQREIELAKP